MRDSLRVTALGFRHPIGHRAGRGRESSAFAESQNDSSDEHHHQAVDQACHDRRTGPDNAADRKRDPRSKFVRHPAAADLEQKIGISKGGKNETRLSLGQRYFFQKLVGCHCRADVHAIKVGEKVHQAKQAEDNVGRSEHIRMHSVSNLGEVMGRI